ncbi:MAG: lysophospholipid acyltransferase family protein [Marmoricola sp.]
MSGDTTYRLVNAVGRGALAALGVDIRPHGLEHLPRAGPVLLASTHGSFLDFVVLEKAAIEHGRYVRFMTRYDAWVPPVLSRVMDAMRHVPVDREAPAGAYLDARRLLRQGEAVGVFPEAGISHSFTVRALMRGTAALARETQVPVLPMAMWGAQRIATVGDPPPRPDLKRGRVVDVAFGEPRYVGSGKDLTRATAELGHRMTAMLEELQQLPHHRPRPGEYAAWYPAHLGGHAPTRTRALELETLPLGVLPPTWGPVTGSGVAS